MLVHQRVSTSPRVTKCRELELELEAVHSVQLRSTGLAARGALAMRGADLWATCGWGRSVKDAMAGEIRQPRLIKAGLETERGAKFKRR